MLYVWGGDNVSWNGVHIRSSTRISRDGRSIAVRYRIGAERRLDRSRSRPIGPNVRIIPVSGLPLHLAGRRMGAVSVSRYLILYPKPPCTGKPAVMEEIPPLPMISKPRFDLLDGCWTADGRYFIYSEMSPRPLVVEPVDPAGDGAWAKGRPKAYGTIR